jgi:hypothetical protein
MFSALRDRHRSCGATTTYATCSRPSTRLPQLEIMSITTFRRYCTAFPRNNNPLHWFRVAVSYNGHGFFASMFP